MFKMKFLCIVLPIVFILFSCSENSNEPAKINNQYNENAALVILVENNDGLLWEASEYEEYIDLFKPVFSDIFSIPIKSMDGMDLNEIIEVYGEEWQINAITKAGEDYYGTIVSLSDDALTENNLLKKLKQLSEEGKTIDMVFCLHGDYNSFYLTNDHSVDVQNFCNVLTSNNVHIRSLYQTCCHSYHNMYKWEKYGINAVTSLSGYNSISIFSPQYFVENWVGGMNFESAVHKAYEQELETIKNIEVSDQFLKSVLLSLISDDNLDGSQHICGGKNKKLDWNEF